MERNLHTPDWERLALNFSEGNIKALEAFYNELYPPLVLYAYRWLNNQQDAEEIATDAFLRTWPHRAKLDSFGAIRAYLYKTVKTACFRHKQSRNRTEKKLAGYQQSLMATNEPTHYDNLVIAETSRLVRVALRQLPAASRKVMEMHILEGKSLAEIAENLQRADSTVRNQKKAAIAALKKSFIRLSHFIFLTML